MNVQNIPRKNQEIRNIFVASPRYSFVEADYSQAEIRVLAQLSGDAYLRQVYIDKRDLHSEMAREIFGEGFTSEDRQRAKEINFGVPYGLSAEGLAIRFGVTVEYARQLIRQWFAAAPQAGEYINLCRQAPLLRRTLVTPFNRRRRFHLVTPDNVRGLQNEACNFPISSTASDLTLHSAIKLGELFKTFGRTKGEYDVRIVNIVHDSILTEVREGVDVQEVKCLMVDVMESRPKELIGAIVPFVADVKVGKRWGRLEKME